MPLDDLRLTHVPAVKVGMLIRRPPGEVFRAFADPAITTRFWFTSSSGELAPGSTVRWEWEMYGVATDVAVEEIDEDRLIRFDWGEGADTTTVELRFIPVGDDRTYLHVTETGLAGDGDRIVARVADSTGGFTQVVCAAKALLEHGDVLTVVRDHAPPEGVEL